MFQKARESTYLESTSLLMLLIKWRKPLLISILLGLVLSFIFSGPAFITPKFKSTVIFFPSATNSVSKALLEESLSEKQDILAFGEEEQAEQMLQMLNSDEIRAAIVNKYDLLKHYEIDPDEKFPMTKLYEEFNDNISFARTEFMSVRIDVLDRDAQQAADMANDISSLLDSMKTRLQRSRANEALAIVQRAYTDKLAAMKVKEDSLQMLCGKGVMDFESQSKILNKEYAEALSAWARDKSTLTRAELSSSGDATLKDARAAMAGSSARVATLKNELTNLAKYGGASVSLNGQLLLEREELSKLKEQLDKISVDANQNLTSQFVVNRAVKAEKKSYPVRWLIVGISVVITFLLALTLILAFEKIKELRFNMQ